MLDLRSLADAPLQIRPSWGPPQGARYAGPDRRQVLPAPRDWLSATLDELDYGVILVTRDAQIVHINHVARVELAGGHPLQRVGRHLRVQSARDDLVLREALGSATQRGLRKLVVIGEGAEQVAVSVVPLGTDGETAAASPTLLVLGRRGVCQSLSVPAFARSHGLTTAEARVLASLCSGLTPKSIASDLGVEISTVRTQIGTIRTKTGAESIRALVLQVAQLPPLMGVLRQLGGSSGEEAV